MTSLLLPRLALPSAQAEDPAAPRVADERIVLRTVAGDIVLALYPEVAPQHVKHLLKLAEFGVYDTTHFFRIVPGFVLQVSSASERVYPLGREQNALIRRLPAEFSKVPHRRGVLSMAR